jgi:hypothetical protein
MEKVQFISIDFTKTLPGPCIFGPHYDFASKLYTMGAIAVVIYVGSWQLVKCSSGEHQQAWAKKAVSWLPTALFVAYPGFSAFFFQALQCRPIGHLPSGALRYYLASDLSVECAGEVYDRLRAVAISCVVIWCIGLPMIAMVLLWPQRSNLLQGRKPLGLSEHLQDIYFPYKPQFWFFEGFEYGRKLFLVGIVPWATNQGIVGAVIALLVAAVFFSLVLAMLPYTNKSDHFVAVCSHASLCIVILLSVLLKMDAAFIAKTAGGNFEVACRIQRTGGGRVCGGLHNFGEAGSTGGRAGTGLACRQKR